MYKDKYKYVYIYFAFSCPYFRPDCYLCFKLLKYF